MNRLWLARKLKPGMDNAAVRHATRDHLSIEWTCVGVKYEGTIDKKLARLLARRINEALDFRE